MVLTHSSGRYNSGQVSASAVDADNEDEQRRSLLMLKAEAEGSPQAVPPRIAIIRASLDGGSVRCVALR